MAQSKIHITPDNMPGWLASTGFLFPRNELELARFEKLYPIEEEDIDDFEVDCNAILNRTLKIAKSITLEREAKDEDIVPLRMVARKGNSLPKHILDKIKKNQDGRTKDDSGDPEEGAE
ncbi:hypothetical protein [Olivibacter sitiensis]|uniref:hypothetical protein n=1 Tax=Olivibacter sitiensis TaxID=376470 RepID=UPI000489D787|nr:hypothetical protein [Olivibacter sitiensis]